MFYRFTYDHENICIQEECLDQIANTFSKKEEKIEKEDLSKYNIKMNF